MSAKKKDTDASPEAEVEETKADGATEDNDTQDQYRLVPDDIVMIRHLGRHKKSRTLRASRAGHRRQGFLLNDGTRIRRKSRRSTQVSFKKLLDNANRIVEGVLCGYLEVRKRDSDRPMELGEFQSFIMELADQYKVEITWERGRLESLERLVPVHQLEPVSGPVPGFKGDGPPPAPDVDDEATDDEGTDGTDDEGEGTEGDTETQGTGLVDDDGQEVMTLDAEELKKLTRDALNEMASGQFGIEKVAELSNKDAVIEAIFAAAEEQE